MGLLICLVIIVASITGYFKWVHTYWRRRGINGPSGLPIIGNYYELSDPSRPRGFILSQWTKIYGKVYGYYEGANKVLVVSDLDMLQEMFIKKFDVFYARKSTNLIHGDLESTKEEPRVNLFAARGARWKRLRTLASPAFSIKSLKKVHDVVEDTMLNIMDALEVHADGSSFNIHLFFQEYTYDVINRLAMGQPHCEIFRNEGVGIVKKIFANSLQVLPWYLAVMFPKFEYQIKMLFFNHKNVRGGDVGKLLLFCQEAVKNRMKERAENSKLGIENPQNDFIDMFLDHHADYVADTKFGECSVEKKATTEDVIGSSFVFLLAGFDTTANTLAYCSYQLAKNPAKMRIAQKEIDEICQNGNISFDETVKLNYCEAVIKESLRLCPVAYFACSRECVETTTLGDYKIEKGTKIEADVVSIHRSKEIWGEDADKFIPERFIGNTPRHVMSWIPFGAGPRQCVGMRLGILEAKLALAHILRRYDIVAGPDIESDLHYIGCTTTSPEKVTVQIKSRF